MSSTSKKYKGLGRGLETLLNPAGTDAMNKSVLETTEVAGLQKLPIFSLRSGLYQPRKDFNEAALKSLAQSIKSQGLVQPIIAKKIADKQYEIIAGERRWRAAQLAGLSEISVIVRDDIEPQQAMVLALIENIQREDLSAIEEAEGLQCLYQEFKLTHEQIARFVGRSRAAITNALRLLDLDAGVQQLVRRGKLKMGHVRALLPLKHEEQLRLAQLAIAEKKSVRQVEIAVQNILANTAQASIAHDEIGNKITAQFQKLQQELKKLLRNDVIIQPKRNGSGKIQIPFGSINELNSLVQVWSQALNPHQQSQPQRRERQNHEEI